MPFLNCGYHCNSLSYCYKINCSKTEEKLAMFGHKNKDTHSNIVSEFKKNSHTSLILTTIIMRTLSLTQKNHILSMFDAGHSTHHIGSITGVHASTISRLHSKEHSELHKSSGGRPTKLSPINIHHAVHLITTRKAENAVQVIKSLKTITNQSLSPTTV